MSALWLLAIGYPAGLRSSDKCLSGLSANRLSGVTNTFALVWFRRADRSNPRGELTDLLFVAAAHDQTAWVRGLLYLSLHSFGDLENNSIGKADLELKRTALLPDAIANADDLQAFSVSLGHPEDHIIDQRPLKTMKLPLGSSVGRALHEKLLLFRIDCARDARGQMMIEVAERPLDRHVAPVQGELYVVRNGYRLFSNA